MTQQLMDLQEQFDAALAKGLILTRDTRTTDEIMQYEERSYSCPCD